MPHFTGTDTNGVALTASNQNWFTLIGQTVSNAGDAFDFAGYGYGSYTVMGNVLSDQDGISSNGSSYGNSVTIASTGFVYGDSDGIELLGSSHRVVNNGEIHGAESSGIEMVGNSGPSSARIVNNGTVRGNYQGVMLDTGDSLTNSGLIFGAGSGVLLSGPDNTLINFGEIRGNSVGINVTSVSAGTNTIVNHGTISTTGTGSSADAIYSGAMIGWLNIVNHGVINGDVDLFSSDDTFDAADGTLNGALEGGSGDDTLILRQPNPGALMTFDGEGDSDTLDLSQFASAAWIGLDFAGIEAWTRGDMTMTSGEWRTIADLENVENVIGTNGVDYFSGNAEDNTFGYVGTQLIDGVEQMFGRGGSDTADFSRFESAVWVSLSFDGIEAWTEDDADATDAAGAFRAIARLDGIENITGTVGVDYLVGDAGDNTFGYLGRSDLLGVEEIDGKGGADTADFSRFDRAVWIDMTYGPEEAWTQDDFNAKDTSGTFRAIADLTGIENLTGSAHSDLIYGSAGANVIEGGNGDDLLRGRAGADTFVFVSNDMTTFGLDTISDFDADDAEKIDLSAVANITSFTDLMNNHLSDVGGTATIDDGAGSTITLDGWASANFGAGNPISVDDFIF